MSTVSPEPGFLEDHPEEKPAPDAESSEGEEGASRVRRVLRCALPAALALLLVGLGVGFAMTIGSSSDVSSLNTNPNEAKDKPDESEAKRTETVGNIDKAKVDEKAEEAKQNVSDTPVANNSNTNTAPSAGSQNNAPSSGGNTSNGGTTGGNTNNTPDPAPTPTPEPPAHVHTPVAVTKQVEKYEQQWVSNMVYVPQYTCGTCGAKFSTSGEADAHLIASGRGGCGAYYSSGFYEDRGTTQNVFVGYETVPDGYVCSSCGEKM